MSNLMLTLDDAVKVAEQYVLDGLDIRMDDDDRELLRTELEQKCYLPGPEGDARERLVGLIMDVNPAEIASQIESDHLRSWCQTIQVNMQMELMKL